MHSTLLAFSLVKGIQTENHRPSWSRARAADFRKKGDIRTQWSKIFSHLISAGQQSTDAPHIEWCVTGRTHGSTHRQSPPRKKRSARSASIFYLRTLLNALPSPPFTPRSPQSSLQLVCGVFPEMVRLILYPSEHCRCPLWPPLFSPRLGMHSAFDVAQRASFFYFSK